MIREKKALFIVLMVTISLVYQIFIVYGEQYTPLLKISTDDVYLTAGTENQVEITLKNTGDFDVFEIKAALSVPSTTQGISIINGQYNIFNKISEGDSKTYHPTLHVDRDVPLGSYTITLQVDYRKMYKIGSPQLESAIVQIGVVVNDTINPEIRVNAALEELKLKTGSRENAHIRIENNGEEPVYEIDATVTSSSPYVAVTEGERFAMKVLEKGENTTFTSTLTVSKNAPLGVYTLTMDVSFEEDDGRKHLESFSLGFSIDSVQVPNQTSIILKRYYTTLEIVRPGDELDLNLELECLGAMAYDVKTMLSIDFNTGIATMSPTLLSVGDLKPGQSEKVSYKLIVGGEVKAGQYPAVLSIGYLDVDGVASSLTETVTLSVRGVVEFRLIGVDAIKVEKGAVTEFEADLLLIGTESVQFVEIEVVEDQDLRRVSDGEEYIGVVDPDSPIPFDLKFEAAEGATLGERTLTLRLTYTDDLNIEHEAIIELLIEVTEASAEEGSSRGLFESFWLWLRRLLGLLP
jgi:hypothetical protein